MTIRQSLTKLLLGDELNKLEEIKDLYERAYREGPALLSPESLRRSLEEVDSQLLDLIIRQQGYDVLYGRGVGGDLKFTEADRLRVVRESRRMAFYDTQTKNAIETWTDFGFGRSVSVVPNDPKAIPVMEEFWTARRNKALLGQRNVHQLSNMVTQDGELFFVFWTNEFSGLNGSTTTLRLLKTDQISSIICKPDDDLIPLYYVQNATGEHRQIYYPDWCADPADLAKIEIPSGSIVASELREGTSVVAMQAALGKMESRGWPQFHQAFQWFRAYKDALGDVLAKNRAVAMFVDKLKATSGSRAIDSIASRLSSTYATTSNWTEDNPAPVPGSTWIENEALTRSRMPLSTAAGDDRQSTMIVLGQGSAGTKVPLGWSGRADAWQNRSVAEMTVMPWMETMNRYQSWWIDVLNDLGEIVLRQSGKEFSDYSSTVTLETPVDIDLVLLVQMFGAVEKAALDGAMPFEQAQVILEKLATIGLEKFGVRDAQKLLEPKVKAQVNRAVDIAKQNLADGSVTAEEVAEFALGVLIDNGITN